MDDFIAKMIQREAADALLDVGVSIPLKEFRLPLRKRPVRLRVTLRRPRLSGMMRFARIYLSLGVTASAMADFDKEQQMRFLATHGGHVCRMLACVICVGPVKSLFAGAVAWFIRHSVEPRFLFAAMRKFVSLIGTDPFIPIIRSAERMNPMKPRLSRAATGS